MGKSKRHKNSRRPSYQAVMAKQTEQYYQDKTTEEAGADLSQLLDTIPQAKAREAILKGLRRTLAADLLEWKNKPDFSVAAWKSHALEELQGLVGERGITQYHIDNAIADALRGQERKFAEQLRSDLSYAEARQRAVDAVAPSIQGEPETPEAVLPTPAKIDAWASLKKSWKSIPFTRKILIVVLFPLVYVILCIIAARLNYQNGHYRQPMKEKQNV